MTGGGGGRLLIYAPVPLFDHAGELHVERQAVNGLRLWAENFSGVTVMMPVSRAPPPVGWLPLAEQDAVLAGVRFEPVPMAYRPDRFLRAYRGVRAQIGALLGEHDYLSFAIGGLFGDWGAVACFEAHRQQRRFAVWTDRVESEVVRLGRHAGPWRHRLRARLTHRPMAALERAVIRRASLGLFHGRETYDSYRQYCANPHMVHDIHLSRQDHIAAGDLVRKRRDAQAGPLRLLYAGRAEPMKGPGDWIEVLKTLADDRVEFTATWLGDGGELERMRRDVDAAGLGGRVSMPGFVDDPEQVRNRMQGAHAFVFCHKTPESPRCLIEALAAGTPIVGYDGGYASDLIAANGGGVLVPVGDIAGLAAAVAALDGDRARLGDLIGAAHRDGAPHTDVAVFRHRSELIKRYL